MTAPYRPPPPTAVEERRIANITRHRNLPVLRRYITRRGD